MLPKGAPATLVYPAPQQPASPTPTSSITFADTSSLPARRADQLYRGGLRIQTTLDPKLQQDARGVGGSRPWDGTAPPLEMSLVSVEPQTGHVRALVGGRDFCRTRPTCALGGCQQPPPGRDRCSSPPTCQDGNSPAGGRDGAPARLIVQAVRAGDRLRARRAAPTSRINGPQSIYTSPPGARARRARCIHNAGDSEGGVQHRPAPGDLVSRSTRCTPS